MPPFTAFQAVLPTVSPTVPGTVTIGKDFRVLTPVDVLALGVFDPGGPLPGLFTISIFDRTSFAAPVVSATLAGTDGTSAFGHRFVALGTPVTLPAGFAGSVVVSNMTAASWNYGNSGTTHDTGGGLLAIGYPPDLYRYDTGGNGNIYPDPPDAVNTGSVNNPDNFAIGSFQFRASVPLGWLPAYPAQGRTLGPPPLWLPATWNLPFRGATRVVDPGRSTAVRVGPDPNRSTAEPD